MPQAECASAGVRTISFVIPSSSPTDALKARMRGKIGATPGIPQQEGERNLSPARQRLAVQLARLSADL
jgi:hypothetical protein